MSKPFRLLLIGDSDSQLLACEALCRFPDQLNVCLLYTSDAADE